MRSSIPESLLKYETPILVSSSYKAKQKDNNKFKAKSYTASSGKGSEDYLNKILPPQEIHEKGQLWVRYVSATPATTFDVTNLARDLDKQLKAQEARNSGICPIREEIHAQCFDEIIRQITINCAERGYLLVRVRDEVRMNKHTYQGLYDSSIAYGLKKALAAEQRRLNQAERIQMLEKQCKELEQKCQEREDYIERVTSEEKEERDRLNEEHANIKQEKYTEVVKLKNELDKVLSFKIVV
jgi:dynein light intermediate chain, axonemal